jgi:putative spermidine/putrescine transport system substrate-binding protein
VLDGNRLPTEWRQKFETIPDRTRVPSRDMLEAKALTEPAAEVMVRLHADFRQRIIEGS